MNIEEAIEILKMWNKAEELIINESTDYDKTVYIQRKEAIETLLTAYEKQSKEIEEYKILFKKQGQLEQEKQKLIKQGWLNE